MKNVVIERKVKIQVTRTAEQWDLYTHDPRFRTGCDAAASAMNSALQRTVNAGYTRPQVEHQMSKVMQEFSRYGACDSEPQRILEKILDEVYGEEV